MEAKFKQNSVMNEHGYSSKIEHFLKIFFLLEVNQYLSENIQLN